MEIPELLLENISALNELSEEEFISSFQGLATQIIDNKSFQGQNRGAQSVGLLFVEWARQGLEERDVLTLLQDNHIGQKLAERLCKVYEGERAGLTARLVGIGSFLPKLYDVRWRLEAVTQDSLTGRRAELRYTVELLLQRQPDLYSSRAGAGRTIKFQCSVMELQDLLGKLKEAQLKLQNIGKC